MRDIAVATFWLDDEDVGAHGTGSTTLLTCVRFIVEPGVGVGLWHWIVCQGHNELLVSLVAHSRTIENVRFQERGTLHANSFSRVHRHSLAIMSEKHCYYIGSILGLSRRRCFSIFSLLPFSSRWFRLFLTSIDVDVLIKERERCCKKNPLKSKIIFPDL